MEEKNKGKLLGFFLSTGPGHRRILPLGHVVRS